MTESGGVSHVNEIAVSTADCGFNLVCREAKVKLIDDGGHVGMPMCPSERFQRRSWMLRPLVMKRAVAPMQFQSSMRSLGKVLKLRVM